MGVFIPGMGGKVVNISAFIDARIHVFYMNADEMRYEGGMNDV